MQFDEFEFQRDANPPARASQHHLDGLPLHFRRVRIQAQQWRAPHRVHLMNFDREGHTGDPLQLNQLNNELADLVSFFFKLKC